MKTFKKNQIIVFVIGLMIIAAGYLNFTNNNNNNMLEASALADSEEMASIGDAKLVSANVAESNSIETNIESDQTDIATNEIANEVGTEVNNEIEGNNIDDNNSETQETNANISTNEYFTNSRLERNTMYSQRIENYQDILNNTNVSETQKKTAQEEITKLNEEQNAIMIAENIIKTKGIEDVAILVNGESINVIVKGEDLKEEEIAQIQNIVTRELGAKIENIHIMNKT